ncbi:hypothetical protein BDV40DRAFT_281015 [Aspergillus tamarii]|uniref:Uncharacterized protein n=1 Tax=Aspergillus tamarii TaxID=41984 RepID=A0A5N6UE33_ASPTM|nr:hypothetical protein BDV40DRAFT_281015 [Aspergillus tamarii]
MPRLVGSPKDAASPEQCLLSQAKRQACYHCRVQKLRVILHHHTNQKGSHLIMIVL